MTKEEFKEFKEYIIRKFGIMFSSLDDYEEGTLGLPTLLSLLNGDIRDIQDKVREKAVEAAVAYEKGAKNETK